MAVYSFWSALAFSNEVSTLLAPNGDIASIESPYGKIISSSRKAGFSDPLNFSVYQRDSAALKLLVSKGHTLNPPGYQPNTALKHAVTDYSRSQKTDHPELWSLIETLLQLGADPAQDGSSAIDEAIRFEQIELAILLLNYSRGPLEGFFLREKTINEALENHPNLAKAFIHANRAVPEAVIDLALENQSPVLWQAAVSSSLPIAREAYYWIDGEPVPLHLDSMRKLDLPENAHVKAYVESIGKLSPIIGTPINLQAFFRANQLTLLLSTNGAYSKTMEETFLNYATTLCVHRIGKNCGGQDAIQRAENWLKQANISCSGEPEKYFDTLFCKLSVVYIKNTPIKISIFTQENDSNEGLYSGLEAFCQLGQRSLLYGGTPLGKLQQSCVPLTSQVH